MGQSSPSRGPSPCMRVVGGRGRPGALGGTSSQGEDQAPGSSEAEQKFVSIDTAVCVIIDTAVCVYIDTVVAVCVRHDRRELG